MPGIRPSRIVTPILLLAGLCLANPALLEAQSPPVGSPKARFAENEVDQGILLQGEIVEREVVLHNDGTAPLHITKATPSCGCTTIVSVPQVVEPGGQAVLRFEINSKRIKPGPGRKRIRLSTNDPVAENGDYYFSVEVVALYRSLPPEIHLSGVYDQEKRTTIRLQGTSEYGFELEGAAPREGYFEIEEFYLLEEGLYELVLLAPAVSAPSEVRDPLDLIIKTKDGREVRVGQWVNIDHQHPVEVIPETALQFGNRETDLLLVEGASPVTKSVTLRARDPRANFTVLSARLEGIPADAFTVQVVPVVEGSAYKVDVTLPAYRDEAFLIGKLIIETDATIEPVRELVLRAKFGRRR